MQPRYMRDSRVVKTNRIFPTDVNNHNTLFGGKLMSYIDDIASISATRHCRRFVVTASTDSVDFLLPINPSDSVCLESFVTSTGNSSMEVFVKVIAEDLMSGKRSIAATAFLTFVAMDDNRKPIAVPDVIAETAEEIKLHESAPQRSLMRKERRAESKKLAAHLTTDHPWETHDYK